MPLDFAFVALAAVALVRSVVIGGDPVALETSPDARGAFAVATVVLTTSFFATEFARARGGAVPGVVPSRVAVVRSVAWLLGVLGASWCLARSNAFGVDVIPMVLLPAFFLDIQDELALARQRGALTCVAVPSTMPDVALMKALLVESGVECTVRCERQRRFYHLFGPCYETQVLVPSIDAERATKMLAAAALIA